MRYSFFLYSDEGAYAQRSEADMQQELAVFGAYIGALQEAGVFVATDWLQPTATATTVSMRAGEAVVHDGPFSETKEQLGGYFVIEAPSLDVALEWAKKCPVAHYGKVEVRASAMGA
ncbi:YciI family protein [Microbacterium sp.]|uniref:YciI family protein n=1 Tax=Microbacterium sp. TaxID=51671 RepID=UPI0039E5FC43